MNCAPIFATFMTCARIFKLLRAPVIVSTASIPYNLSFLYAVMEQETPQQWPLNVIYIWVLVGNGHGSIYSMAADKYLLYIPFLAPTQFQESNPPP